MVACSFCGTEKEEKGWVTLEADLEEVEREQDITLLITLNCDDT